MTELSHLRMILFISLVCLLSPIFAQAQIELSRISMAARSDGMGYVIRLHLNESIDSAKVFQSGQGLVQVALYAPDLSTKSPRLSNFGDPLDHIDLTKTIWGIGIDVFIKEGTYFISDVYPDANKTDWLIALTHASEKDVTTLTDGISAINWIYISDVSKSSEIDDSYNQLNINYEDSTINETTLLEDDIFLDDVLTITNNNEEYDRIKSRTMFDLVVIDAGHGGKDPGTIGYTRKKEKDISLKVALKLGQYIKQNLPSVDVLYTRTDDRFIDLEDRGHLANNSQGDLFISIHCNAAKNRRAHGTEVFFLGQHRTEDAFEIMMQENSVVKLGDESKSQTLSEEQLVVYELTNSGYQSSAQMLAGMIDEQFKNRVGRKSRGVKQAGFIVLYYASMPSILVELGFISNKNEERFLNSDYGQTLMASALFRAIRDYKNSVDKSTNKN